eukprot:6213273-Pleurochrysis_carterae.AAC.5
MSLIARISKHTISSLSCATDISWSMIAGSRALSHCITEELIPQLSHLHFTDGFPDRLLKAQ